MASTGFASHRDQSITRGKPSADFKIGNAISIDGPAASGKTAVGSELARRLGFQFLDTGGMYRAVTLLALEAGIDVRDEAALTELSRRSRIDPVGGPSGDRLMVNGRDITDGLRAPKVDLSVSQVSTTKGVRIALVEQQRKIADQGPIVMVGRDIGTVVLPDAKGKVYLDASAEVRAHRRVRDMTDLGRDVSYDRVVTELKARDGIDSQRKESPLRPAEGALILDTDDMSVDEIADTVMRYFKPQQWR